MAPSINLLKSVTNQLLKSNNQLAVLSRSFHVIQNVLFSFYFKIFQIESNRNIEKLEFVRTAISQRRESNASNTIGPNGQQIQSHIGAR